MIQVLEIICFTIVICTLIRYVCIWNCQRTEYKIYRKMNNLDVQTFNVRPYFYNDPDKPNDSFWGYVVYDIKNEKVYTGVGKENTKFIIYRKKEHAEKLCDEVRGMYGN